MKAIRSISVVFLAMLVLVSSTSFMVGIHLCGGRVQNVAFLSKADGCLMEKLMPPCHKKEPKSCCKDETIIHEGEDFKNSPSSITLAPIAAIDLQLPMVLVSELIPSAPPTTHEWYDYDPPLRAEDRVVTHQIFLI